MLRTLAPGLGQMPRTPAREGVASSQLQGFLPKPALWGHSRVPSSDLRPPSPKPKPPED
jgi:hypothetical protein